ncbi:hypothetical protein AB0E63_32365 [Kribbella sp. NPDC026596]|uniref:hypothetical protein n=1 Tax=Kribbella sp. NPDC026596 TaxID=3155122 RepID=UPI0033D78395
MFAFLTASECCDQGLEPEVRIAESTPADLVRTTDLGLGIDVEVDLADPERWRSVSVRRWDETDLALLDAVIGPDAVRRLSELRADLLASGRPRAESELSVEFTPARPWRRIAVIDALDWWLQLPLDQALLDAERAVVRAQAARSLPAGQLRRDRTDQALVLARRSADGFANYLTELTESASSLPRALFSGLLRLVNGYAVLGRRVVDGPDEELEAVAYAWQSLKAALPVVGTFKPPDRSVTYQLGAKSLVGQVALTSSVDPRQLRARIVDTDVRAQEIRMLMSREGSAVRVIVPAFGSRRQPAVLADRLMVRLVDTRSGAAHEPVLLTLRSGPEAERLGVRTPVFTEVVPLRGAPVEYVRADVFDPASEATPAQTDTDIALLRQRRAQFVLGEWRRAAAEARLSRGVTVRKRRLARLVDVLMQTGDSDQPAFFGGPTPAELAQLIEHPDDAVHRWFTSTDGAGELLVAELAAAHANR